jgi:hypothetical protein
MPSYSCSVFTWFAVGLEANLRRIGNVSFKEKGIIFSPQKNNINMCIRGTGVKKEEISLFSIPFKMLLKSPRN